MSAMEPFHRKENTDLRIDTKCVCLFQMFVNLLKSSLKVPIRCKLKTHGAKGGGAQGL